jgi:hypothetical protein
LDILFAIPWLLSAVSTASIVAAAWDVATLTVAPNVSTQYRASNIGCILTDPSPTTVMVRGRIASDPDGSTLAADAGTGVALLWAIPVEATLR